MYKLQAYFSSYVVSLQKRILKVKDPQKKSKPSKYRTDFAGLSPL